jgi:hypothetical protein
MCWSLSLLAVLRALLASFSPCAVQATSEPAVPVEAEVTAVQATPSAPLRLTVPPATVRSEWFEVRRASDPAADPIAVVRLVRVDAAGHTLLERDIVWRAEGWRMHHTERLAGHARRLIVREQGPRGALAWTADWDLADASGGRRASVVGHGWARPTHEQTHAAAPWIGALEWLEAARAGASPELGPVAWLTPSRGLSGAACPARSAERGTSPSAAFTGPEGRATFEGGALSSFELSTSELLATPIAEAEYEHLAGRWAWRPVGRHPFVQAALRRDETLRKLAALGPSAILTRE